MRCRRLVLILLGIFVCPGMVTAEGPGPSDFICYMDTLENRYASFTTSLHVPQFDPALGTLELVTVQLQLAQDSFVKAELLNPQVPGLYEYELNWNMTMTGLGGQTLLQLLDGADASGGLTAFDGLHDFEGTSGFTDLYSSEDDDGRLFTSITPGFDSFIGTGSMEFVVQALATLYMAGTGAPFDIVHQTGVNASVEICYEYVPIPEPAGLALGTGSALILLSRRRKHGVRG